MLNREIRILELWEEWQFSYFKNTISRDTDPLGIDSENYSIAFVKNWVKSEWRLSIIDLAGGVSEGTFIDHVSGPVEGTVEMEGQFKQKGGRGDFIDRWQWKFLIFNWLHSGPSGSADFSEIIILTLLSLDLWLRQKKNYEMMRDGNLIYLCV